MLEFMFTIGQAASTMLLVYGAVLVLTPAGKAPARDEQPLLLGHLHSDA
jgi:hypothetical protein